MDFAKSLYKKWWVVIVAVVLGGWIGWFTFNEYKSWQINRPYREEALEQMKALAAWKAESDQLRNIYKKDKYGGETPEETLQLFIDAMKVGNYELASKYYLPEQQNEQLAIFKKMKDPSFYINILETYDQEGALFPDGVTYEIEFFENGEQKHLERFKLNEYTGKWKLEDY